MAYNFREINRKVVECPAEFVRECDDNYNNHILRAADVIKSKLGQSQIVMLAGPSGSGKTTTAHNIKNVLTSHGIKTHMISLDNYYNDVDPETSPRNKNGDYDFESPNCLDLELLMKHFAQLNVGREVMIPKFEFKNQRRNPDRATPLRLGKNEIAIFEGIHALNSMISDSEEGKHASKVYISARSNIEDEGKVVFKGTWMRISRRAVRDVKYRGTSSATTFAMWNNLRLGEKKYISPYKNRADIIFDSSLEYEVPLMAQYAGMIFEDIRKDVPRYKEITELEEAFKRFNVLSLDYVPTTSLMREFIGGGEHSY
jgi:uridine kinase